MNLAERSITHPEVLTSITIANEADRLMDVILSKFSESPEFAEGLLKWYLADRFGRIEFVKGGSIFKFSYRDKRRRHHESASRYGLRELAISCQNTDKQHTSILLASEKNTNESWGKILRGSTNTGFLPVETASDLAMVEQIIENI